MIELLAAESSKGELSTGGLVFIIVIIVLILCKK